MSTTEQFNTTMESQRVIVMALRTITVKLRNGNQEITVSVLLDDGSTKSYINSDVAAELGLDGPVQTVTVSTMNGNVRMSQTTSVECEVGNIDGKVKQNVSTYTTQKVTGKMKSTEWRVHGKNWSHLKYIKFPWLAPRPVIDNLIEIDYAELHRSLEECPGKPREPIARTTPLGWTCTGSLSKPTEEAVLMSYNCIHSMQGYEISDIGGLLQKYWEIESTGMLREDEYCSDDREVLRIAEESAEGSLPDDQYQIAMPWKNDPKDLHDSYETAHKQLVSTEKRLLQDKELEKVYSKVIDDYKEKGYISKVNESNTKEK